MILEKAERYIVYIIYQCNIRNIAFADMPPKRHPLQWPVKNVYKNIVQRLIKKDLKNLSDFRL